MKDYAEKFYKSTKWQKCRLAYLTEHCFICERCGRPATMVHHKKYITPSNINDPDIVFNPNNLEALCEDCHAQEHHRLSRTVDGVMFDDNGDLIKCGVK
jgi:5-methylcytosine-specific restriction endonuclease McrA